MKFLVVFNRVYKAVGIPSLEFCCLEKAYLADSEDVTDLALYAVIGLLKQSTVYDPENSKAYILS